MESIQKDTLRWAEEVGSLVGPTTILFYPHASGLRPADPQIGADLQVDDVPGVIELHIALEVRPDLGVRWPEA